jgi:probable rRNA maturation factor
MALSLELSGEIVLASGFTTSLSEVFSDQCSLGESTYIVEVVILSEAEMRELNSSSRGKDSATDVLSFPIFPNLESIIAQNTPEVILGSIIICPSYAASQGTALEELLLHGLLHLIGFDHEADLARWFEVEQASIVALKEKGFTLTGIEKGYL